jgi:hypothetical protein
LWSGEWFGSYQAGGVVAFVGLVGVANAEEFEIDEPFDIPADLVGVALGKEFFLDIGTFGPFPAFLFFFRIGADLEEGKAMLFEGETAGAEIAAAEVGDVGAEFPEMLEFGLWVLVGGDEGMGEGGVADGEGRGAGFGARTWNLGRSERNEIQRRTT